jgi:hypothetical protein
MQEAQSARLHDERLASLYETVANGSGQDNAKVESQEKCLP